MSQSNLITKNEHQNNDNTRSAIKRNSTYRTNFIGLKSAINELNHSENVISAFSNNVNNKKLRFSNSNIRVTNNDKRRPDEELTVAIKMLNQSVNELKKAIITLTNKIPTIKNIETELNNNFDSSTNAKSCSNASSGSALMNNNDTSVTIENNNKTDNSLVTLPSQNLIDNDDFIYDDSDDIVSPFYEIPSDEILEIYKESSSEYNFAVRLCKRIFKKSELMNKNVYGKVFRKNERKDSLDPIRINYVKDICLELCKYDDANKFWAKCVVAINKMILQIPKNRVNLNDKDANKSS